MENFSNIIEHNTSELKNGNMSAYLAVLEDSIYQYEERYGPMKGCAYLRNYVRSCFRNDLAKKGGYDSFGRKQFKTYIKRWFHKVGER
ncbi:hypothetical protein GL178_18350 [Vibrio toranzoniae]|uniref:hypothetical protein n=1 Tax=Vibrio TaxID=662 RepID=UPI0011B5B7F5|nr:MULTISPECIES: hypothetical protein [Vibrio]NAZ48132.1 hypothetical protein [Vibrio toranzoniae]